MRLFVFGALLSLVLSVLYLFMGVALGISGTHGSLVLRL